MGQRPRVHVGEAHGTFGGSGTLTAEGQAYPPRPAPDEPIEAWVPYLLERIEMGEEGLGHVRLELRAQVAAFRRRVDEEAVQRSEDFAEVERRVAQVVGGEGGRGLDRTWYGLTLTLLGIALQGAASVAT